MTEKCMYCDRDAWGNVISIQRIPDDVRLQEKNDDDCKC
jgi:hypothetical protein